MTKNEMKLIGLVLAGCISDERHVGPADWVSAEEEASGEPFDLMLGSGNNYWLRVMEGGPYHLRVQARSISLREFEAMVATRMIRAAKTIEDETGIAVTVPWDEQSVHRAMAEHEANRRSMKPVR